MSVALENGWAHRIHASSVTVLYGSQTGNAEEISKLICDDLRSKSFRGKVQCMSLLAFLKEHEDVLSLVKQKVVIFVCSTTGQGDPPDNAMRFWTKLNRTKEEGALKGLHYAILGLGDSNYSDFNNMAKRINKKLKSLGATRFMDPVYADDATGLESFVEPFRKRVLTALAHAFKPVDATAEQKGDSKQVHGQTEEVKSIDNTPCDVKSIAVDISDNKKAGDSRDTAAPVAAVAVQKPKGLPRYRECEVRLDLRGAGGGVRSPIEKAMNHDELAKHMLMRRWQGFKTTSDLQGCTPDAPVMAQLKNARFLTSSQSGKHVLHVEFALPHSTRDCVIYQPGDSLGVYAPNTSAMVQDLLDRLGAHDIADQRFKLSPRAADTTSATAASSASVVAEQCRIAEEALEAAQTAAEVTLENAAASARDAAAETVEALRAALTSIRAASAKASVTRAAASGHSTALTDFPTDRLRPSASVGDIAQAEGMTIREAFLFLYDITSPPRKAFLRMLAEHCSSEQDKAHLYLLCSRDGRELYENEILQQRTGVLDLLRRFKTCSPPLEHVMQMLPPLMPRYYSASSSPAVSPNSVEVAFTLVEYVTPPPGSCKRKGLCSFWLYDLCKAGNLLKEDTYVQAGAAAGLQTGGGSSGSSSVTHYPGAVLDNCGKIYIPVFFRRSRTFKVPEDMKKPLIMIGPGTGVAPFRGFLQHRQATMAALSTGGVALGDWRGVDVELLDEEEDISDLYSGVVSRRLPSPPPLSTVSKGALAKESKAASPPAAPAILFFGCRNQHDFLYQKDFELLQSKGVVDMHVAFSRDTSEKVYVQHLLEQQGEAMAKLILEQDAYVFVCGDGSKMAQGVMAAVVALIAKWGKIESTAAREKVMSMMKQGRYVQDVWS